MKSRISLFNKTVLLKDITRFCPVWIIFSILSIMPVLGNVSTAVMMPEENYGAYQIDMSTGSMAITSFVYAMICAFFLFGDLFKGRLCNALHALPLRRETWFATHALAGFLFFLVPNTAVALIYLLFLGQCWFLSPLWLLAGSVMYLFFFSLALVCIMLTGSRFAATAVYLLINFFSMLCYWMVETYYAPLLPGLHIPSDIFTWFCPVAMLASGEYFVVEETYVFKHSWSNGIYRYTFHGLTNDWLYICIAAGLALALIALALVLYRKRKLESAGDFLAFRKPQPVFLVIFSLAVGAIFQTIFGLFDSNVVSMIIGLIIGSYAGQMLLRRSIKVFDKRSFFWCGSLACALILTLALTYIDPLGLTRWTPEPEQVTSITLSDNYEFDDSMMEYYSKDPTVTIKDPEQIRKVISIHQRIISQKAYIIPESIYAYNPYITSVHITYHMADGREVVRRYYLGNKALFTELQPFFCDTEFLLGYTDFETFFNEVDTVILDGNEIRTASQARALLEAVWADCENGDMYQGSDNPTYSSGHWIEIQTKHNYIQLEVFGSSQKTLDWINSRNNTH